MQTFVLNAAVTGTDCSNFVLFAIVAPRTSFYVVVIEECITEKQCIKSKFSLVLGIVTA